MSELRRIWRYGRLVASHWVSLTVAGTLAATLGLLSLTPLKIAITWTDLLLLLAGGLVVAQYQVWAEMREDQIIQRAPALVRIFDIGIAYGEYQVSTMNSSVMQRLSGETLTARPMSPFNRLSTRTNSRLTALYNELGWEPEEYTEDQLYGLISSWGDRYTTAFEIGRRVSVASETISCFFSFTDIDGDPADAKILLDHEMIDAGFDEFRSRASHVNELLKRLHISNSSVLTNYCDKWTSFPNSPGIYEWLDAIDELKKRLRKEISELL